MKLDRTIARAPSEWKGSRLCQCDRCRQDGQHAPMCSVHDDTEPGEYGKRCDCGRAPQA